MAEVQILSTSLVEQDEKNKREWVDDDAHSEISEVTGETKPEPRSSHLRTPPPRTGSSDSGLPNTGSNHSGVITNSSLRFVAAAAGSGSVCGDDNMSFSSTMSRSEVLRAKLRAHEQRLSSLVKTASSDSATGMISQMAHLKGTLEQVEQQKTLLESELSRLKHATDGDEYLKEKMSGIQEGFTKQVEKIQELEDQLETKKREIDELQQELYNKLKRIVELEFDLETHDIHYTSYAAEQFKLGEDALQELKTCDSDTGVSIVHKSSNGGAVGEQEIKVTPKRAQRLISKLLSDLDSLENRYKQEKLKNETKIEHLSADNESLRTQTITLEKQVKEYEEKAEKMEEDDKDDSSAISDDFSAINNHDEIKLRQRIQVLNAKRSLYRQDMVKAQQELEAARQEHRLHQDLHETTVEKLHLENEALRYRLQKIQSGSAYVDEASDFTVLEKKIADNYQQVSRLQSALTIKDQQLETLKKELSNLRVKEIAHSDGKNGKYTAHDVEIAKSQQHKPAVTRSVEDEDRSGLTEATDASYLRELQQHLQEVQQQLVKKDQELVIERAKAASTAAGLLARITELNKHVPLPPTPEGSPLVGTVTPTRSGSRRHSSGSRLTSLAENPKENEDHSDNASVSSNTSGGGRRLGFLKRKGKRRTSRGEQ